jgi:uncharacterized protein (TIGR03435 family)
MKRSSLSFVAGLTTIAMAVTVAAQTAQKAAFEVAAIEWGPITDSPAWRLALPPEERMAGTAAEQVSPSFDVTTVKKSGPEVVTRHFSIQGRRFVTTNTSLADLIQYAYGLHPRQIMNGPKWLESDKFDVVGSFSSEHSTEQEWMKMTASLLASRFQLHFHLEKRELPVYAIVVTRDGPKLKLSGGDPNSPGGFRLRGRGQLIATNANVADLAWELQSAVLDRPVVDQTGLASRFNFTLTWAPDEFQKPNLAGEAPASDVPDLFTAIQQQLGLRLESTKSLVDVMVVDHIEQPSEN